MDTTTTVTAPPAINITSNGVATLYFAQLINTLTGAFHSLPPNYPPNANTKSNLPDIIHTGVIVVGGGTSGCIVASRVSEFPHVDVLLIEDGSDPPVEVEIPRLWPSLMKSEWDRFYETESSDSACLAMKEGRCAWPKARMLGGSAAMNAMYSVRGNPKDYDKWRDAGNDHWGYADLLPYFKMLETAKGPHLNFSIHGTDGPIGVEFVHNTEMFHSDDIEKAFENAAKQAGIPYVHDCSTETEPCVTRTLFTVRDGLRSHPAKEYLIPAAAQRKNLKVMRESRVLKVLIEKVGEENRAYGVLMDVGDGKIVEVRASIGVVLCAGSVSSPHLLMLSGVGSADHLREFGIDVVVDLPGVGLNLQDHIIMSHYMAKYTAPFSSKEETTVTDPMYAFLVHRDGFYSSPMFPAVVFVNSADHVEYPDIQFLLEALPPNSPTIRDFCEAMNFGPEVADGIAEITAHDYTLNFHLTLLRPKSQGRIMLCSADPWKDPKILHGYLSDPDDIKSIIAGLKYADKMMDTAALGFAKPITLPTEKCDHLATEAGDRDAFLECYVRHFMTTVFHQCGTCKMGPVEDPLSVVDSRLTVHGVTNLMVADAAIFPNIVSGNIQMAVMMVAEKAAHLVAENWNLNKDC